MTPPVRGLTWELLGVYPAGDEGLECEDGHPALRYRIVVATTAADGEAGVAALDKVLCAAGAQAFMERFG